MYLARGRSLPQLRGRSGSRACRGVQRREQRVLTRFGYEGLTQPHRVVEPVIKGLPLHAEQIGCLPSRKLATDNRIEPLGCLAERIEILPPRIVQKRAMVARSQIRRAKRAS